MNDARQRRARRTVTTHKTLEEMLKEGQAAQYANGTQAGSEGGPTMASEIVMRGVTLNWLSQVFGIPHGKVKYLLKDCPIKAQHKNGAIYELKVAASYLVKPVVDVEEYMKTLKIEDLPTRLQDQYWSAMNKRQKWEENAGLLWRTERVSAAVGELLLFVKESANLFVQNLETTTEVTPRQRELLEGMTRGMLGELFKRIGKLRLRPPEEKVRPVLAEEDEQLRAEAAKKAPPPPEFEDDEHEDEEPEFDAMDLV